MGLGFDKAFVKKYTVVEKSGKHPKTWIFDSHGNKLKSIEGVYSLDFAYGIARDISADLTGAQSKMGRGFQAQALVIEFKKFIAATEIVA